MKFKKLSVILCSMTIVGGGTSSCAVTARDVEISSKVESCCYEKISENNREDSSGSIEKNCVARLATLFVRPLDICIYLEMVY